MVVSTPSRSQAPGDAGTHPPDPATPESAELEGGEQQRAGLSPRHQRVASLLTQLASTARSFLLYDPKNAAIQRFITTLLDNLLATLKSEGRLELEAQPFELRFAGQVVYLNEDRERSLAFRLYRDGVRSITFQDGFDWEELAKLLEIFSIRYTGVHQQEDDVVTLLWKANFQHLDIVAVEGFVPEDSDAEGDAGASEAAASALPEHLDLPMPPLRPPSQPSWVPVDDATREALRAEVSASALADDCVLLLRRLRPLLADPRQQATLAGLAHLYGEVRDFLLSDENLVALSGLIGLLDELARTAPPPWDPDRTSVAMVLLRSCGDERAVRRLIHSVPAEERTARPELIDLLDRACADPLGAVVAAHALEPGPGARAVARQLLVRHGAGKAELLHQRFDAARGHVAMDLFQVIVALGGESEALFCAHNASHPDGEVREEALRALESMRYSGPMGRALFDAFRRVAGNDRLRVLALIERSGDRRFVEHLAGYLEREAGRVAPEEGTEIGRVLGRLGGGASLATWQQWLRPAGRLRRGLQGPLALQAAAAAAVGEIPGEDAAEVLRAALAAAGPEAEPWIGHALAHHRRPLPARSAS